MILRRFTTTAIGQYTTTTAASSSPSTILTKTFPAASLGHIKLLILNRPDAKNAISRALLSDLSTAISSIHTEGGVGETRALIIASSDTSPKGVFCAGADLKERKTFTPAMTTSFLTSLNSLLNMIQGLKIPTISAIPCHAHGGGLELALATDLRITTTAAQLSLPETRLGIIPGAGGTMRLPQLIGKSRALDMVLTGRRIGAEEALNFGLVNKVVPAEQDVNEAAVELAQKICEGGPLAITAAKAAVTLAAEGKVGIEQLAYAGVVESEDKYEALKAFGEKRKPVFKGR